MLQNFDRRRFLELSGATATTLALGARSAEATTPGLADLVPLFPVCRDLTVARIDRSPKMDLDKRMTYLVLQGLVNRKRAQLYLISTETCVFWLDYYRERYGVEHVRVESPDRLLSQYRDEVSGYRIYDPNNFHTFNLAATMAHMDGALPVHPKHEESLKKAGLRRVDDLRGKFRDRYDAYDWAIDNLLAQCSRRVVANVCMDRPHWPSMCVESLDQMVSLGAFQMDCSASRANPRDLALLHRMYEQTEAPGVVLGWHCHRDTEHEAVGVAARHGLFVICSLRAPNYSVHRAVGNVSAESISQPLPGERRAKSGSVEPKVYLAPLITDGDAAWAMTNKLNSKWEHSERGEFAMNWGFMPSVYHLGPGLFSYYRETRKEQDYLIAGPSGIGYTYPHMHPDPLPFLRMTREGMKRLGTTIANVVAWDPRFAHHGVHPYDFYKLLRQELPEATGFVRGMAESVWEPSWLEGNAPVVYGSLAVHAQDDTYARIRALVDACPNRPLFIFAYINHNISLAQLLDAASRKPGEIEFLRLDEFMTKLRAARDTGMIGNDLYPVKEQCAGLLADEMRPQWASAVESVVDLGERVADSVDNCLAYYAAQPGGCAATDLTAAVQFELCQGAANLVKMACNGRGVFVGNRKKGVEDFLQLYSSAPDAQSIVEVSKWWHRWDRESVKSIETLRKAADRVLRVARWLEKVNKGWEPLPK